MLDQDELLTVLSALARTRPIFHSEADFQHALAWQIQLRHPDAAVRLEYPPFPEERLHLDLWVWDAAATLALELKYCTQAASATVNGEMFRLTHQNAHPPHRRAFVADVGRLERVRQAYPNARAYAILLTNDHLYWDSPKATGGVGEAFLLHDGARLVGPLAWASHTSPGTSGKGADPLDLQGTYVLNWGVYANVQTVSGPGQFRVLVVTVT